MVVESAAPPRPLPRRSATDLEGRVKLLAGKVASFWRNLLCPFEMSLRVQKSKHQIQCP